MMVSSLLSENLWTLYLYPDARPLNPLTSGPAVYRIARTKVVGLLYEWGHHAPVDAVD